MRPNAAVRMGKGANDGLLQARGPSAVARTDLGNCQLGNCIATRKLWNRKSTFKLKLCL